MAINFKQAAPFTVAKAAPPMLTIKAEIDAAPALSVKSKPGPKPSGSSKTLLSLRVDPDVIEWFKAAGPGWQSRMNAALRTFSGLS